VQTAINSMLLRSCGDEDNVAPAVHSSSRQQLHPVAVYSARRSWLGTVSVHRRLSDPSGRTTVIDYVPSASTAPPARVATADRLRAWLSDDDARRTSSSFVCSVDAVTADAARQDRLQWSSTNEITQRKHAAQRRAFFEPQRICTRSRYLSVGRVNLAAYRWSFRKTGTAGTLASRAEIGVWVRAPGALQQGSGVGLSPSGKKILRLCMQNPAI